VEKAVAGADHVVVVPGAAGVVDVGGEAAVRTVLRHADMLASAGTGAHPPLGRVLTAQVRRSSEVGGSRCSAHPGREHWPGHGPGSGWVVMADPEGNQFCVLKSPAEREAFLAARG